MNDSLVMRVLVCGSRSFTDVVLMREKLERLTASGAQIVIVHGGAQGADRIAGRCARSLGFEVEMHEADWGRKSDGSFDKQAGFRRNQKMLDSGVHMVLAFVDKPLELSRGTADMVGRAKRAGVSGVVVHARKAVRS